MGNGYKDLKTWQKAYELALLIYSETKGFPKEEQFGLTLQMRRAVLSVSANIAEGYERQYRKEYIQFLNIAKGYLSEVETYVLFSKDIGYLTREKFERIDLLRQETIRLLKGLIKSLRPIP